MTSAGLHFANMLAQAEARSSPFPHATIDAALAPTLFDDLVAELPPPTSFTTLDKIGFRSVLGYNLRGSTPLAELAAARPLWTELENEFYDPAAETSLRALFSPWIDEALKTRLRQPLRKELWIDCDCAGSSLQPHTDAPSIFIKCILYLSAPAPHPSADTLLFEPRDTARRARSLPGGAGDYTDATYKHEDWSDHRVLTRVAFRPNRMLTFLRSSRSLHSLASLAAEAAPRYVVSFHLKFARES